MARERVERPLSGELVDRALCLREIVLGGVVGDIFAEARLTGPVEMDHRRLAEEAARDLLLEALELVAFDDEGEIADGVVEAHG